MVAKLAKVPCPECLKGDTSLQPDCEGGCKGSGYIKMAHVLSASQIVWWCNECGTYTLKHEGECPMMCETLNFGTAKQRRRRGYICADCDGESDMWLSKAAFIEGHGLIDAVD
jgi:hypothetical protein